MLESVFNKELQSNFAKRILQLKGFLVSIAEFLRSHVWTTSANDYFYQMLFWQDQSKAFCLLHTYSFKILVLERKYKNNLKKREYIKKKKISFSYNSHINNVYVAKSSGFDKILKVKICVFEICTQITQQNTGPVTRDHVKSSQMRNITPLRF